MSCYLYKDFFYSLIGGSVVLLKINKSYLYARSIPVNWEWNSKHFGMLL